MDITGELVVITGAVYPQTRFVATLPAGSRAGQIFWNSRQNKMYGRFND